jgi:RNA polymerase sigma-70 factor (ECF subfamily)
VEERQLIERSRSGDRKAFGCLVRQYYARIFRSALLFLKDRARAEDFTQEVFLAAFRSVRRFEGRSSFYSWLYGIYLNLARKRLRDRGRETGRKEVTIEGWASLPAPRAERKEDVMALVDAVTSLPSELRSVVELCYFDRLSYREIAGVLGCPEGTVKSRLYYAKEKIREKLKDHELFRRYRYPSDGEPAEEKES